MQNLLSRVGNPALRQGIIFGVILGIVLFGLSFIFNSFIIILGLCLIAGVIAGMRASQETGKMITGTLAGLWTGLIGLFIPSVISLILAFVNIDAVRRNLQDTANQQHLGITYTNSQIITFVLINFLLGIALGVILGSIGGVIGGTMARSRRQQNQPPPREYGEAMFEPPPQNPPAE